MSSTITAVLNEIFHPRSIAVVGASASRPEAGWVARLQHFGYDGKIYPVNPRAKEISGLTAYPTVRDIPGEVDYAIFNIPARLAPRVMQDCAVKHVKVAHIYTAGFSETGKEEGKALQEQVVSEARAGGVRVIGPNCMGIYYPAAGLTFNPAFSREPGNVAFISQTGAGATRFVSLANSRGIHFSKVVSYGNAVDLDISDFLEYLIDDAETEIVTCYIEGVRDGRRFIEMVRKCMAVKPVIIMKAGLTESGAGAAASHTSSLAGSKTTWDAFFRQTGAIRVDTLEEIADLVPALQYLRTPNGRRVGIVGRGGGIGVIATDTCDNAGLKVPPFHAETRNRLEEIIPEAGAGARNPVETTLGIDGAVDFYTRGLRVVDADPEIDFIMVHIAADIYGGRHSEWIEQLMKAADVLADTAVTLAKPLVIVLSAGENADTVAAVLEARQRLLNAGIPVYLSIEAAARAMIRLIDYYSYQDGVVKWQ
ncbi:MAG TPA: hypothetical protein G4O07_09595 [Dehalococcoidia bacterium]|nr:hypothetical protein [Dehalococcoidia bacterium]